MRIMTHREPWQKRILKEKKKELVASVAFAFVLALVTLLWHYYTHKSFEWQSIDPLEQPALIPRLFYSGIAYVTIGAFLYFVGFYKFLYSLFRGMEGGWDDYNQAKGIIWLIIILVVYFIVKLLIDAVNMVASFFFNIFNFILYMFPPLGITAIVFVIGYYFVKQWHIKAHK